MSVTLVVTSVNTFLLMTKNEWTWVVIHLANAQGRIGEDLKKYARTLAFLQGREEPVKVPSDVRAFLDMYCVDLMGHDVKTIMEHYSDRFLYSGTSKKGMEQFFRNETLSSTHKDVISEEATVTVFEAQGDKAYVGGFFVEKVSGRTNATKIPMGAQQIINEHGQWRWFGNRK